MTDDSSAVVPLKITSGVNLMSVHELVDHTGDIFNLIARRAFEIFPSRSEGRPS